MKLTFPAVLAVLLFAVGARAQTTTFTYQGQLGFNGGPASGNYSLRFAIYDASSGGNLVGGPLTNAPVGLTNGLFTTALNFGSVFNGAGRWLEIGVRPHGDTNQFTFLSPRQQFTSAPYAIRAIDAANLTGILGASNLVGIVAVSNLPPTVALLNSNANFQFNVSSPQFIGNGGGLSNLTATALAGTVPDARLSSNVARLNAPANFSSNVSALLFSGNGDGLTNVPGILYQVIPTGVNVLAAKNNGYLATNNLIPVVVTLPGSATIRIGETVRVSGSAAGGWRIAQNAGQSILIGNLLQNSVGQTFTSRGVTNAWKAVAVSTDGSKMVASAGAGGANPSGIYTTSDYGTTWNFQAASPAAQCLASSGDGVNLVAGVNGGSLYLSSSSGASWSPTGGAAAWTGVGSSLDGTKLIACASGVTGGVWTYAGGVWTPRITSTSFVAVGSSADGARLLAAQGGSQLRVSHDSGLTWIQRGPMGISWTAITVSADGSRMAATSTTQIYVSTDYGTNWMTVGPNFSWTGLAGSADGSRLAAVYASGGLYVSTDSGLTWSSRSLSGAIAWTSVGMSSDASAIVAMGTSSGIFVSAQVSTTPGVTGYLSGSRLSAVELQYVGNGVFMPVSYVGTIRAN